MNRWFFSVICAAGLVAASAAAADSPTGSATQTSSGDTHTDTDATSTYDADTTMAPAPAEEYDRASPDTVARTSGDGPDPCDPGGPTINCAAGSH